VLPQLIATRWPLSTQVEGGEGVAHESPTASDQTKLEHLKRQGQEGGKRCSTYERGKEPWNWWWAFAVMFIFRCNSMSDPQHARVCTPLAAQLASQYILSDHH
jgi:hypothetical protein